MSENQQLSCHEAQSGGYHDDNCDIFQARARK